MQAAALIHAIQASAVGEWMRSSLKAMPLVEACHVLAATTVFGTIFVVDLRLLGFPNLRRAFTRISRELLGLTWCAFGLSVITGALMFAANASTYMINTAFRLKLLALLCAGVNMLIFQFFTFRGVAAWDVDVPGPRAARVAGALSILLWVTVVVLGRWIGFTKGYDFSVPDDPNIKFDF